MREPMRNVNASAGSRQWVHRLREPALVLAGQGIQSAGNFGTGVMVGRFGSAAELGLYALGGTAIFLLLMLTDTLLTTPFTHMAMRRPSMTARTRALRATLLGGCILGAGSGALCVLVGLTSTQLAPLLPTLPLALLMVGLREILRRNCYVEQRPGRAMSSDLGTFVIQFTVLGWLAAGHQVTSAGAFAAMAAGNGVMLTVGLMAVPWPVRRHGGQALRYVRSYLKYGRWLAAGSLCQIAAGQSLGWFLFLADDARATGTFAACLALTNILNPVLIGLTNYARPRLMQVYATKGWGALLQSTRQLLPVFTIPVLLFAVLAVLYGGLLLSAVYGPELSTAGPVLIPIVLALVATAIAAPVQLAALAIGRPRVIFAMHASAAGTAGCLGGPLVWRLGLNGAAIACCASAVVGLMVLLGCLYGELVLRRQSGPTHVTHLNRPC